MRDFELIVHIGSGKTGSSSIQKTLRENADALDEQRIKYLGLMLEQAPRIMYKWQASGGWPKYINQSVEKRHEQMSELLSSTIKTLIDQGYTAAIWSNESIFGNHQTIIPVLESLREVGVHVRVVCYIRKHDSWAQSAYFQWGIKHKTYKGPIASFKDWINDNNVSFYSGIQPWLSSNISKFYLRNFDHCGDVVKDFFECSQVKEEKIEFKRENETPNDMALALWALYNNQFDGQVLPVQLLRLLSQSGILTKTPEDFSLDHLVISEKDLEHVRLKCIDDRENVNQVFKSLGQPRLDESPAKPRGVHVSQNQINAALLLMIKNQSDQIFQLTKELKKLKSNDF